MSDGRTPTYPVKTIAALFGLHPRRVQQLSKEGIIPKAARGQYELAPTIQAYIRYLKERAPVGKATGTIDYHDEKARLTKANADIAELQLAKAKADVLAREEVEEIIIALVAEARAKLLNEAPTRIAALAKTESDETKLKALVKTEVSAALAALSGTPPEEIVGRIADE